MTKEHAFTDERCRLSRFFNFMNQKLLCKVNEEKIVGNLKTIELNQSHSRIFKILFQFFRLTIGFK